MSTTATLVQLAAELTLFVVAVAGAGLSIRAGLLGLDRAARMLLVAGFLVLAAVAFGVGSLTIDRTEAPVALAAVRCAGSSIVALGALRWAGSRVGRPTLLGGLVALAVAAVVEARGIDVLGDGVGAEPLVLVAGVVIGAALVVAGRHTIPGRIGTSVAGVLLAVVLLVSFSVSAVISRTVEDEALRRYGDRAEAEAAAALAEAELSLQEATLVAAGLTGGRGADLALLGDPESPAAARDAARGRVAAAVGELAEGLAIEAPIVVVAPDGVPVVVEPADLASATALSLAGDPVVLEALEVEGPRQGVSAVGAEAYALAAVPTRATDGDTGPGAVVVARPLDDAFLQGRIASDSEPLGLAIVTREEVAATSGSGGPPAAAVVRRARAAIDVGVGDGDFDDGRAVVARVVAAADAPPQLALVLSAPSERVGRTREDLYRSLFLVAMLAGLVGIALSVLLGERIGGGIRALTAAASRIREGDLTARAAVEREDELGELSSTFDAMAVSLHHLTDDLREAATEEGRLRARLESVFSGVTEAVVAADAEHRVTDLNRAAAELLGLADADDAVGRPLEQVVDLVGGDGAPLSLAPPEGAPRVVAGHLRPGDDGAEPVPVLGTVASLGGGAGGARSGVVVVLRDIRREQALEAAKQDFLATIGHELRTPLTPIKGYAGLLRRRPPSADQARSWADGITAGVDRLEQMVDRLVTFAAVTAGAGTAGPAHEEVDVAVLVDAVARDWRARLGDEREVVVDVPDGLPPIRADEAQVRLALGELVDNAARFSTGGEPVVLRAELVDDASAVALVVADGGGPAAAALDGLVGVFQQGEAAATRSRDGLGLGLALTDRVARAHGGRLEIATSPAGTIVSILVPVVTAHEREPS
ncbi:HAMP domain-containing protein [Iamia sp. SCSIO 61187]|uniref:sensor histidine kinase n=1 Tax=Iamia sp. SCSIO 61187 TaxID=2722752 RepID=UPI001C63665E|nr:histidine kinase dimerization/phospho-acceptor domain-containing protein [Iamia sp. SCSIO 61187]QYG91386.1 HAMP domain-containing protein [Iamia sp. SCSIO 61187]